MARRSYADLPDSGFAACSSPVLLVAAIARAVAAVSRLAKRLGLDSVDSAEIIDSEEDAHISVTAAARRLLGCSRICSAGWYAIKRYRPVMCRDMGNARSSAA